MRGQGKRHPNFTMSNCGYNRAGVNHWFTSEQHSRSPVHKDVLNRITPEGLTQAYAENLELATRQGPLFCGQAEICGHSRASYKRCDITFSSSLAIWRGSYHFGYVLELPSAHKSNLTHHVGALIGVVPGYPVLLEWRVSFGFLRTRGRHDFGARLGDRSPYQKLPARKMASHIRVC